MSKGKGVNAKLYFGAAVFPATDFTFDENMNLVEDSDVGDVGENYDATQYSGKVSGNGNFDTANAAHAAAITSLRAGTEVAVTWIISGTKGSGSAIGVSGNMKLASFQRKTDKKGLIPFSFSGNVNGVLTDASNL